MRITRLWKVSLLLWRTSESGSAKFVLKQAQVHNAKFTKIFRQLECIGFRFFLDSQAFRNLLDGSSRDSNEWQDVETGKGLCDYVYFVEGATFLVGECFLFLSSPAFLRRFLRSSWKFYSLVEKFSELLLIKIIISVANDYFYFLFI